MSTSSLSPRFDAAQLAQEIDKLEPGHLQNDFLLSILNESSEFHANRRPRESLRLKGYTLASLERLGTPEQAVEIAIEELMAGDDAYVVAAAARALRGSYATIALVSPLITAIQNMVHVDDQVSFDSFRPQYPLLNPTSAVAELLETLRWLGASVAIDSQELEVLLDSGDYRFTEAQRKQIVDIIHALRSWTEPARIGKCCAINYRAKSTVRTLSPDDVSAEDQDGSPISFAQILRSKSTTLVAFFYTRCGNPRKCSATITKLAQVQQLLMRYPTVDFVQIIAITYDAGFDVPVRLKSYGHDRGFRFGSSSKFLRITRGYEQLRDSLALCVGYTGSVVSQHAVELFIFDSNARVVGNFSRQAWKPEDLLSALSMSKSPSWFGRQGLLGGRVSGILSSAFVAFLPKCPFCWSVYLSAFGITAMNSTSAWQSITTLSLIAFTIHLLMVFRQCSQTRFWLPLFASGLGIAVLASSLFVESFANFRLVGLAIVIASSFLGQWSMLPTRSAPLFRK